MTASTKRCRTIHFLESRGLGSNANSNDRRSVLIAAPYQFEACERVDKHGIRISLHLPLTSDAFYLTVDTPCLWLAKRVGRWTVWLGKHDNTYDKVATGMAVDSLCGTFVFPGYYTGRTITNSWVSRIAVTLDVDDCKLGAMSVR
jgi:hypothetical protein